MAGAEARFPRLCALTGLTRLEVTAIPAIAHSRAPCLVTVAAAISRLARLRTLRVRFETQLNCQ